MAQEEQQMGLDWEEDFQRLTPSQFFRKNKQMLGFTGKIRSLTIVFHELITNLMHVKKLESCQTSILN